ncbi:MAG: FHA domain-containing protein [Deltaproteobacteria bacterium]|nr:FHA domain-containing protein [Deltaproteobacteria bacterium]
MRFGIVVNDGNEISTFDFENAAISIGRSSDNDIQLNDKHASRHHLMLWGEEDRIFAKDLGSENGTYVNDRQIPSGKTIELEKGHSIRTNIPTPNTEQSKTSILEVFSFLVGKSLIGLRIEKS